jgi:hypothetical protein
MLNANVLNVVILNLRYAEFYADSGIIVMKKVL